MITEGITVRRLAEYLGRRDRGLGESRALKLQPNGVGAPFFGVHGIGGNPLNYYALARVMGADRPFLALQGGWDEAAAEAESIETLATRYVAAIRREHPDGPYLVGGYSFGVTIAFEIAQQLVRSGCQVRCLVMIDAPPSGYRVPRTRLPFAAWHFLTNLPAWVREDLLVNGKAAFAASVRRHLQRIGRKLRGSTATDITRVLDPNRVTPIVPHGVV